MIAATKRARENKTPFLGVCLGMQIAVIEYVRNVCNLRDASSVECKSYPASVLFPHIIFWRLYVVPHSHFHFFVLMLANLRRSVDEGTNHPVIISMPEINQKKLGGTMRLGMRPTHFQLGTEWSKIHKVYSSSSPICPSSSRAVHRRTDDDDRTKVAAPKQSTNLPGNSEKGAPGLVIYERHRHRYEVNPKYISTLISHGMSFVSKDDRGERIEIPELGDHPWFVSVQFHPEYLSRVLEPSRAYLGFLASSAGCFDQIVRKVIENRIA